MEATSLGGSKMKSNFSFIFDNLEPMPPIVPVKLIGNNVYGKTNFANTSILITDFQGSILSPINFKSDAQGNFQTSLNLNGESNLVKFYTKNFQGVKSQLIERIIYSKEFIENNIVINSANLNTNLKKSKP